MQMHNLIGLVLLAAVTTAAGAYVSDVHVNNITLQHKPSTARAPVAVQYTVVAPALGPAQAQNMLPLIFVLNGYNVEARDYLDLSTLLAQKGYPVVLSDYLRPPPPGLPANFFPANCPADQVQTSAALLTTFVGAVASASEPLLKSLANRGTVLLGHSNGGAAAAVVMDGICSNITALAANPSYKGFCEGYTPQFASPSMGMLPGTGVAGDTAARQTNGDSAVHGAKDVGTATILGAVLYEGYLSMPRNASNASNFLDVRVVGLSLPPGTFLAYLAGAYNNNTYYGYEETRRESPDNCVSFVRFEGVGHFGLCNPQPSGNEVTRCAVKASADSAKTVALGVKERAIAAIADSIDATVLANVLKDQAATARLTALRRQTAAMGSGAAMGPSAVNGISQMLLSDACLPQSSG